MQIHIFNIFESLQTRYFGRRLKHGHLKKTGHKGDKDKKEDSDSDIEEALKKIERDTAQEALIQLLRAERQ